MKSLRESLRSVNEGLDKDNKEEKDFIVKLLKSGKIQKNVTTIYLKQSVDPKIVNEFCKWALKEYIGYVEDFVIDQENEDSFYKIFCSEMYERSSWGAEEFWTYIESIYNLSIDDFDDVAETLHEISNYIENECKKKYGF